MSVLSRNVDSYYVIHMMLFLRSELKIQKIMLFIEFLLHSIASVNIPLNPNQNNYIHLAFLCSVDKVNNSVFDG